MYDMYGTKGLIPTLGLEKAGFLVWDEWPWDIGLVYPNVGYIPTGLASL